MNRSKPPVILAVCFVGVAASALAGDTRSTPAIPPARAGIQPAIQAKAAPHHHAEHHAISAAAVLNALWARHDDRTLAREFTLSFEDPSRPGRLDIDIKRGDILVHAYAGDQVLVRLFVPNRTSQAVEHTPDGFRAVSGRPLDFKVRQDGNTIELDGNSNTQITHIEVLVPRRIDLTLDSYRSGVIRVAGVKGHIRARSYQNNIILSDIVGSADVNATNGNVAADFHAVTGELSFDTYNGDIDLTLPAEIRTTTYIRSESHDVKSQFPIARNLAEVVVTNHDDGSRSIEFGEFVIGDINGGGLRTMIETTNGAVLLRRP